MQRQKDSVLVASDFLLSDLSHYAKLVYLILASKSTKYGTTASFREMARLSGLSINTIRKAVNELVNRKVIRKCPHIAGEQGVYKITTVKAKTGRSISVPCYILYNRKIQPVQKVLYAVLSIFRGYGKDDSCYPAYTTLAKALCLCKRTIQRAVDGLRVLGCIQTQLIRSADRFPYLQYFFVTPENFVNKEDVEPTKEESVYRNLMCHIRQEQEKEVLDKKKVCDGTSDSSTDKNKNKKLNIKLSDAYYRPNSQTCQEDFSNLSASEIEHSIKEQIGYHDILLDRPELRNNIDDCIRCLTNALKSAKRNGTVTIRGQAYSYEDLYNKISQLDRDNILLAITRYTHKSASTIIQHPAAYMLAILIGTTDDIGLHFVNTVNYDFFNK